MQFLFVANGSYRNRGCEAILRGTVGIIREAFGPDIVCINAYFDRTPFPPAYNASDETLIDRPLCMPQGIAYRATEFGRKLLPNRWYRQLINASLRDSIAQSTAVLSLGGDNFTLDYGLPLRFLEQNRFVRDCGIPLIIWGASIGPFDAMPQWAEHLHAHLRDEVTAIFVREPETQQYLARHGIRDHVHFAYDPAFVMEPASVTDAMLGFALPAGAIGINLSPLLAATIHREPDAQLDWASRMITLIHKRCARPLVLIPHVTLPWSDDHAFMAAARERCGARDEIYLAPPTLNAMETKGLIARMYCLVAARTHATIAAFSTGVPTVSLAYSVKAGGLNKLIFGHTDYLVASDALDDERSLTTVLRRVLIEQGDIRSRLRDAYPTMREMAMAAGHILRQRLTQ